MEISNIPNKEFKVMDLNWDELRTLTEPENIKNQSELKKTVTREKHTRRNQEQIKGYTKQMNNRVTHIIGVPEATERMGAEYLPKKEELKTSLTQGKETNIQVQEVQGDANKRNPKRPIP